MFVMNRQIEEKREKTEKGTDYTLLLKRVEKALLHGEDQSRACRFLKDRKVWRALPLEDMLKWASLAQIAGLVDTACEVYEYIIEDSPESEKAWTEYLDLLTILDRREQIASVLSRSGQVMPSAIRESWRKKSSSPVPDKPDNDLASARAPFEEMSWHKGLIENFMELFSGREDIFARQWADRKEGKSGYVPVRRPLEFNDIEEHVQGRKTYGIYLMKKDSTVQCAVLDADLKAEFRKRSLPADQKGIMKKERSFMVSRIRDLSREKGLEPVMEFSGYKGFHFWYFFSAPVSPEKVRVVLREIAEPVNRDISSFDIEVFPKQDRLTGKGYGNLVKLPLGVHRYTGKKSRFSDCSSRTMESQLQYLKNVVKIDSEALNRISGKAEENRIVMHPRVSDGSSEYPELVEMERRCPPLGQLIASCRSKNTITARDEKILFQTVGFLPRGKTLLHYLLAFDPEYNPHMVDYRLSRLRGTPLGCRRIHSLSGFVGDFCGMEPDDTGYLHPLIHLEQWKQTAGKKTGKSGKVENLQSALENLETAIIQVKRFMKQG